MESLLNPQFISFEDFKHHEMQFSWSLPVDKVSGVVGELELASISKTKISGQLNLRRHGRLIRMIARFEASVEQVCGVSLKPLVTKISEDLDLSFTREKDLFRWQRRQGNEIVVSLEDTDPPEIIGPQGIELYDVFMEQLSLSVSTFPRLENENFNNVIESSDEAPAAEDIKPNPFAILAGLKEKS
jgi:uncharacterized metal-binding protein YceD (DUF177 family)